MKTNPYICALLIAFVPVKAADTLPVEAANLLTVIGLKLEEPLPGFRVQILRISPDTFVDPPPQLDSFEGLAAFSLTFQPARHRKQIAAVIEEARKSKWQPMPYPGYPRWCIRFIRPWNEILGALGIDDENYAILVGDKWYKVDEKIVRSLTSELLRSVLETETKTQRQ